MRESLLVPVVHGVVRHVVPAVLLDDDEGRRAPVARLARPLRLEPALAGAAPAILAAAVALVVPDGAVLEALDAA